MPNNSHGSMAEHPQPERHYQLVHVESGYIEHTIIRPAASLPYSWKDFCQHWPILTHSQDYVVKEYIVTFERCPDTMSHAKV